MDKEAKGITHRVKNMIKGLSREGICVPRMGKLSIVAKVLAMAGREAVWGRSSMEVRV